MGSVTRDDEWGIYDVMQVLKIIMSAEDANQMVVGIEI